ncbi:MAG: hypothetical protein H0T42_05450 [Deltaproteobacteria bacterium]|nr:hypothetical protein [Deltaproteobacteria bacterium]
MIGAVRDEAMTATRGWATVLAILLLFAPKIDLIDVPGQTTGLRLDDLVLALAALPLLLSYRNLVSDQSLLWICILVALGLASCAAGDGNVLYVFRIAEYAVFILLGRFSGCDPARIAGLWLAVQLPIAGLQHFGAIGVFRDGDYMAPIVGERASGTTGGPWELAMVTNLASVVLLATRRSRDSGRVALHLAAMAIMLMTGSRSGMAVQAFIAFFDACGARIIPAVSATMVAIVLIVTGDAVIGDRIRGGTFATTFSDIREGAHAAATLGSDGQWWATPAAHEVGDDRDASMAIRAAKWRAVGNTWAESGPVAWLIGLGNGRFGPAVDGGWVRLLCEGGVLGLAAYAAFILHLRRRVQQGWRSLGVPAAAAWSSCLLATFAANMVFIDVHLSYKTMAFLFLILGALSAAADRPERFAEVARRLTRPSTPAEPAPA